MVDTLFTNYAFKATPQDASQVARTLPARLNDVINVKDFGAKGDGVTDDTSAINSAIDYLYTLAPNVPPNVDLHGGLLFFPPGIYQITGQFFLDRGPTAGHRAYYGVMGAGRDVSILRGTFNTGNQTPDTNNSFLVKCARWGMHVCYIRDLTIQNQSTAATSGALEIESLAWFGFSIVNCHIIGNVGVSVDVSNFGTSIRDCIFTCSKPITTANASTRSPLFRYSNFQAPPAGPGGGQLHLGSVGLFINQGAVINCHFTGFDIGMSTSHLPTFVVGCSMSRCGIGIVTSLREGSGNIGNFNDFGGGVIQGSWGAYIPMGTILANKVDRCTWGIHNYAGSNLLVSANRVMGTSGPYDPAAIQSIIFSGGTATVTTTNPHNLPDGTSSLVLVTTPAGWTPDGTGDQIIPCTKTGANTFAYSLGADPGSFTSATWNYPLETAIISRQAANTAYIANTLDARVINASFDMNHSQNPGPVGYVYTYNNAIYATLGPYGWIKAPPRVKASYQYIQCGTTSSNPIGIPFGDLPDGSGGTGNAQPGPMEGQEYTVIDCAVQNSFAGTITGGGSNHYKVRYDGTNWIRVG